MNTRFFIPKASAGDVFLLEVIRPYLLQEACWQRKRCRRAILTDSWTMLGALISASGVLNEVIDDILKQQSILSSFHHVCGQLFKSGHLRMEGETSCGSGSAHEVPTLRRSDICKSQLFYQTDAGPRPARHPIPPGKKFSSVRDPVPWILLCGIVTQLRPSSLYPYYIIT